MARQGFWTAVSVEISSGRPRKSSVPASDQRHRIALRSAHLEDFTHPDPADRMIAVGSLCLLGSDPSQPFV
jgi:hypothetical protein